MSSNAWIKTATTSSIVGAIRQMGYLALQGFGDDKMSEAALLGKLAGVITEIDDERNALATFFTGPYDRPAEKITFEIEDIEANWVLHFCNTPRADFSI